MTQVKRTRTRTPETRVNYYAYLASRDWALKKRAVKMRSQGICENCRRRASENVHHLSYEHLGNEPLEELQDLCRPCHEYFSAVIDINPADVCCTPEQALEWLELLEDEPPEIVEAAERHWREVKALFE